jgi:hypothetical protein
MVLSDFSAPSFFSAFSVFRFSRVHPKILNAEDAGKG